MRLTVFRWLLFPFACAYGVGIWLRNLLYNIGLLSAVRFDVPVIAIGNLAMGGTGKTPHVDWLVTQLKQHTEPVILSRGYGRRTSGYLYAHAASTAADIGDEPMLLHMHHPEVPLAVAEQRALAIPQLLMDAGEQKPFSDHRFVVVLDDAFQHRSLQPGISILLTTYDRLFIDDHLFPVGYLRDMRGSAKRANIIIVTKCPNHLDLQEAQYLQQRLRLRPQQQVFFTGLRYPQPYDFFTQQPVTLLPETEILLVAGIARPQSFLQVWKNSFARVETLFYSDHHRYSSTDLFRVHERYQRLNPDHRIILTTEKDAVKLRAWEADIRKLGWQMVVQPVEIYFLFDQQEIFLKQIDQYIQQTFT
ncbi:MAG: tetraacyldisaccharide 4'-kinase [Thermoflavifilum sp.]|nr:tetraacyldisaccharide 4'-kinase [Thermoflavifilum sp.]